MSNTIFDQKVSKAGNVLFIILIAVALFAALSYTVTSSSRGSGDSISKDKAKLAASKILQLGASVEQAVTGLKVLNGCADIELSFETPQVVSSSNSSAPSDKSCHVFDASGGSAIYSGAQADWLIEDPGGFTPNPLGAQYTGYGELTFVTQTIVQDAGLNDCPSSGNACKGGDIAMLIPFVDKSLCKEYNKALNLNEDITFPDLLGFKFRGHFFKPNAMLPSHRSACLTTTGGNVQFGASGIHYIYYVVHAR